MEPSTPRKNKVTLGLAYRAIPRQIVCPEALVPASPFHLSQGKLVPFKQTRLMTEGLLCRLPPALFHPRKGHGLLQSSVCASKNWGLPYLE